MIFSMTRSHLNTSIGKSSTPKKTFLNYKLSILERRRTLNHIASHPKSTGKQSSSTSTVTAPTPMQTVCSLSASQSTTMKYLQSTKEVLVSLTVKELLSKIKTTSTTTSGYSSSKLSRSLRSTSRRLLSSSSVAPLAVF